VNRRAQDASRGRLHEAAAAGLIDGFIHAYLCRPDERLPIPVYDFVLVDVRQFPQVEGLTWVAYVSTNSAPYVCNICGFVADVISVYAALTLRPLPC
jgi:hypothetical protein